MKFSLSSFFVIAIVGSILLFHPVIVKGEEPAPSEKVHTDESPLQPQDGTLKQVIPTEVKPVIDRIIPQPGMLTDAPVLPPAEGTVSQIMGESVSPSPPRGILTWLNDEIFKDIEIRGYLKNETAYRYESPPAFAKILNILQVEPSYSFNSHVKLNGRALVYYDLAYDFQDVGTIAPVKAFTFIQPPGPGEPEPKIKNLRVIDVDKYGVALKEIYLDLFLGSMDFRIGKQIIRWGIVEGWRILDDVNPLDFKEHILRDIADRYIPLWMVKGDYYLGPLTIEGLWIPDVRGHEPASLRSEWSQFQKLPGLKPVPRTLKNSEAGLRTSGMVGGLEFALTYFYTWDDFPTAFRSIEGLGLGNLGISPSVDFTPRYRRMTEYGLGLAKSFGKIVLEGEVAYVGGKYWGTCTGCTPTGGVFGELQRDYWKHVVGVKTVLFGTDLSLDFSQDIILGHTKEIQQQAHEDAMSLFARKEIRYGTMVPQLLVISLLNRHEYLLRPKLEYRYTDKVTFLFGFDIFSGSPGPDPGRLNFFGYFDHDDRAYMEVKYSF